MKKRMGLMGMLVVAGLMAGAETPLPELLKMKDGTAVTSAAQWPARRAELVSLMTAREFGVRPVERPDTLVFEVLGPDQKLYQDQVILRKVKISAKGPYGDFAFNAYLYLPPEAKRVPAFVYPYLEVMWGHDGITPETPETPSLPVQAIAARGYAVLVFNTAEVAPDDKQPGNELSRGVFAAFGPKARTATSWGTISAWAWGASRGLDFLETQPEIDASRVAVIGHSRGGKTALCAGLTDERFALTVSNDSGCSGAKLNRMDLPKSESVERITRVFPHWFCLDYLANAKRACDVDYDQHFLAGAIAPRGLYIASGTEDLWAGPAGEKRTAELATEAWKLFGHPERVGYHIRPGKHALLAYDWMRYIDFFNALSLRP